MVVWGGISCTEDLSRVPFVNFVEKWIPLERHKQSLLGYISINVVTLGGALQQTTNADLAVKCVFQFCFNYPF